MRQKHVALWIAFVCLAVAAQEWPQLDQNYQHQLIYEFKTSLATKISLDPFSVSLVGKLALSRVLSNVENNILANDHCYLAKLTNMTLLFDVPTIPTSGFDSPSMLTELERPFLFW
jgi:hypothetical protein